MRTSPMSKAEANNSRQQAQREEAMRDGGAERALRPRVHRVDVDPLVVAGGFGEQVDALLVDRDPVADADLLADQGLQILQLGKVFSIRL